MLVDINLLPQDEKKKSPAILLSLLLFLLLLAAIAYAWLAYKQQVSTEERLQQQLLAAQQLTEVLQEKNNGLGDTSTTAIGELQDAILWAEHYPISTYRMLRHLSSLLPERGFILSFSYQDSGDAQLAAQFDSSREAAFFLRSLQDTDFVNAVTLSSLVTDSLAEDEADVLPRYIGQFSLKIDREAVKKSDERGGFLMLSQNITKILWGAVLLLFLAGISYFYWFNYEPLQERIIGLKASIQNEEAIIATLDNNGQGSNEELVVETTELQKRLPVSPLVDQFILDLEQAQLASGSVVTSFQFSEQGTIDAQSNEPAQDPDENAPVEGENEEAPPQLPEGVERLTVSMTVESPSYFELEAFVKELEELPRITKIDSLSFSGNREVRELNESVSKMVYSLTASTFYFPKLDELKDQIPQYELPEPGGKINPLYPTAIIEDNQQNTADDGQNHDRNGTEDLERINEELDGDEEHADPNPTDVQVNYKTYKVKPGDTVFSIAIKFYNTNEGIPLIVQANNLKSNIIKVGQVLIIPELQK